MIIMLWMVMYLVVVVGSHCLMLSFLSLSFSFSVSRFSFQILKTQANKNIKTENIEETMKRKETKTKKKSIY